MARTMLHFDEMIYNYQPCKSVIWRIVSLLEFMPSSGDIIFLWDTIRHITLTRLIIIYYWICYPPWICMKYSTLGVKQQSINRPTHGSTAWSGLTTIMDHWIQHCPRHWIILSSCKYQRFYISTFFLNFWLAYYLLFYTAVTKDMHYCVYDTSHMT